eukprot:scaffold112383_cov52-Prasinocladus_malaysianus.AAC.1
MHLNSRLSVYFPSVSSEHSHCVCVSTGDALRAEPSLRTGRMEYYGPIVNHAARVAAAAHGGQVLVHENTIVSLVQSDFQ